MAKRFTDTEKWKDPWFRKLPPHQKAIWQFLTDNCDQAGFWKKDYELAEFMVGQPVVEGEFLHVFNNGKVRIKDHGSHLEIVDFVFFQYGHLSHDCRPHKHIIELLEKYRNKGYQKGINTLEEQEKEQEKEIKGIVKGGFLKPTIEELEALFREKGFPAEAVKFFDYYEANGWRVGKNPMKKWRPAVANWLRNAKAYGTQGGVQKSSRDYARDNKEFSEKLKAWQKDA